MELAKPHIESYDFMSAGISPHSLGNEMSLAWDNAVPIKYGYKPDAIDVAKALISMSNITVGKVPHIDKLAAEARKMLQVEAPEDLAALNVVFGTPSDDHEQPMG
jgi:hypothetical protein